MCLPGVCSVRPYFCVHGAPGHLGPQTGLRHRGGRGQVRVSSQPEERTNQDVPPAPGLR